jgi:PIN domain nuclease of toxin-antitoxin system
VKYLLDTHIAYWAFYQPSKVGARGLRAIEDAEDIYVSAVNFWEIAIKHRLGKIDANPHEMLLKLGESNFDELPILARHTLDVARLPLHHADPFDRLLISQARSENLTLMTADSFLQNYGKDIFVI